MKKKKGLFAGILLFIAIGTVWGAEGIKYPPEIQNIIDRGYINVAQFGGERAGFFSYDDEKKTKADHGYIYNNRRLVGFDVDLSYIVAKQLGVELKINRDFSSFNDVAEAVAEGKADIAISKLSVTQKRALFVNYTRPYIKFRMGVLINRLEESKIAFLNKDKTDAMGICFVKGIKMGVLADSSFVDHGRKLFPKAELVEYKDRDELFGAVSEGKVLAVIYEEYEISRAIRLDPDLAINCRTEYFNNNNDYIAIAVNPHSYTLLSFLNILLDKENINPSIEFLLNKYVPEQERKSVVRKVEKPVNYSATYTAVIFTLVFAFIWFRFARKSLPA